MFRRPRAGASPAPTIDSRGDPGGRPLPRMRDTGHPALFSASSLGLSIGAPLAVAFGGLFLLAHRFIDELSRPHYDLHDLSFHWGHPPTVPEPPPSQQRLLMFRPPNNGRSIRSRRPLLCGEFWAQPQPAPTVVICHGYRVSRVQLRSVAAIEYEHGYNVLLFDFRGHGESESIPTSGGNAEVRDLQAAISVASQQPETLPGKIILHGFSMGASVVLLTPPHPDVAAIIADSPYACLDDILRRIVQWRLVTWAGSHTQPVGKGWPVWRPISGISRPALRRLRRVFPALAWVTVATSTIVFRLRFGHALIARPETSFRRWHKGTRKGRFIMPIPAAKLAEHVSIPPTRRVAQGRGRPYPYRGIHSVGDQSLGAAAPLAGTPPILLIHGMNDETIPFTHARRLQQAARRYHIPFEFYFVRNARHCGAYEADPEHYILVVQDFIARQAD